MSARRELFTALFCAATMVTGIVTAVAVAQTTPPRVLAWVDSLQGNDGNRLRWPVAVSAGGDGELAVADAYQPRLILFRRVGVSWQVDRSVSLPAAPVGLAHDGERFIATLRQAPYLVAFEGPQLAQRRLTLPSGVVPGALAALPGGELLIHDLTAGRVLRIAGDGSIAREVEIDRRLTGLEPLPGGGFLAAVGDEARVLKFDAAWNPQAEWQLPGDGPEPAWPSAIAVEPGGDALVLDRHTGRILVLDASGSLVGVGARHGWEPGLLLYPADIARLPNGRIAVADQGNGRAQVFRRTDGGTTP